MEKTRLKARLFIYFSPLKLLLPETALSASTLHVSNQVTCLDSSSASRTSGWRSQPGLEFFTSVSAFAGREMGTPSPKQTYQKKPFRLRSEQRPIKFNSAPDGEVRPAISKTVKCLLNVEHLLGPVDLHEPVQVWRGFARAGTDRCFAGLSPLQITGSGKNRDD